MPWSWVTGGPTPISGARSVQSQADTGLHQLVFDGAFTPLNVGAGDKMVAYVYLDPANPPGEVMLQWNAGGSWGHRAS